MNPPPSMPISLTLSPPLAEIEIIGKHGLNILDRRMLRSLKDVVSRLKEEAIKIALIRSGSKKGFAAGADMRELQELDEAKAILFSRLGQSFFQDMEKMPILFIGVIEGYCIGGGFDLALACDLLFYSKKASFQHPGTSRGFITGFGGNHRLAQAVGHQKSIQILTTGKKIPAQEMAEYGLPSFIPPLSSMASKGDPLADARYAARKLSKLHSRQIQLIKRVTQLPTSIPFRSRAFLESSLSMLSYLETI